MSNKSSETKWVRIFILLALCLVAAPVLFYGTMAMRSNVRQRRDRTVTATYQVDREQPYVMPANRQWFDPTEFKTFKSAQLTLLRSDEVLEAAIEKTQDILLVASQPDRLAWLRQKLNISSDADSEILVISMSVPAEETEAGCQVVDAVHRSYYAEYLRRDLQQKTGKIEAASAEIAEMVANMERLSVEIEELSNNAPKQPGLPGSPNAATGDIATADETQQRLDEKLKKLNELREITRQKQELRIKRDRLELESKAGARVQLLQPAIVAIPDRF